MRTVVALMAACVVTATAMAAQVSQNSPARRWYAHAEGGYARSLLKGMPDGGLAARLGLYRQVSPSVLVGLEGSYVRLGSLVREVTFAPGVFEPEGSYFRDEEAPRLWSVGPAARVALGRGSPWPVFTAGLGYVQYQLPLVRTSEVPPGAPPVITRSTLTHRGVDASLGGELRVMTIGQALRLGLAARGDVLALRSSEGGEQPSSWRVEPFVSLALALGW